eukprot:1736961-Pleurochrysis_carterae.AAC.2
MPPLCKSATALVMRCTTAHASSKRAANPATRAPASPGRARARADSLIRAPANREDTTKRANLHTNLNAPARTSIVPQGTRVHAAVALDNHDSFWQSTSLSASVLTRSRSPRRFRRRPGAAKPRTHLEGVSTDAVREQRGVVLHEHVHVEQPARVDAERAAHEGGDVHGAAAARGVLEVDERRRARRRVDEVGHAAVAVQQRHRRRAKRVEQRHQLLR